MVTLYVVRKIPLPEAGQPKADWSVRGTRHAGSQGRFASDAWLEKVEQARTTDLRESSPFEKLISDMLIPASREADRG